MYRSTFPDRLNPSSILTSGKKKSRDIINSR